MGRRNVQEAIDQYLARDYSRGEREDGLNTMSVVFKVGSGWKVTELRMVGTPYIEKLNNFAVEIERRKYGSFVSLKLNANVTSKKSNLPPNELLISLLVAACEHDSLEDGFNAIPSEQLECLEEGALDEGLKARFQDNRPALETLPPRTRAADKSFSHVILFKQLPTEEEQPAFIRWFKKKRAECSKLDRPLNTFWPEEEIRQEIRVSLLSR